MKNVRVVCGIDRSYYKNIGRLRRLNEKQVSTINAVDWVPVSIKVPASLTVSDKDEGKNTIYTYTLKFLTCEDMKERRHLAFRVALTDGSYILLGTGDRPFCKVTVTDNMPSAVTENQQREVTVTYVTTRSIMVLV